MDYKKEYFEVTYTWQSGETVYDRSHGSFETEYKDDVKHLLRMKSRNKKDFKFWVRKVTLCREEVKDIIL